MITLNYNKVAYEAKSVSAAWNIIRKLRDAGQLTNDTVMKVIVPDGADLSRIPTKILFRTNKNGKIEFKDFNKVLARREAKKAAEEKPAEVA